MNSRTSFLISGLESGGYVLRRHYALCARREQQQSESFAFHVGLFFAFQQPGEDFKRVSEFIEQENRRMARRAAWSRYFNEIDVPEIRRPQAAGERSIAV
jgi:hypothetical protein